MVANSCRASACTLAMSAVFGASALAQTLPTTFATVGVGSSSSTHSIPITVTFPGGGTVGSVLVLTQGQPSLDFQTGSSAGTCSGATLAAAASCTVPVTFAPLTPGLRTGAVVLLDNSPAANVLGATPISGIGQGGLGVLVAGSNNGVFIGPTVVSVAGDGYYLDANVGDGLAATSAELDFPSGVALDGAGNLYIADTLHNRIRMVTAPVATGTISTVAGTGSSSFSGDNGPAGAATLISPGGVAVDGMGNIYIADTGNNRIRKITKATGWITTVAGSATPGYAGDGAAATSASLNGPQGVTVDAAGNIWIADTGNSVIREVTAVDGNIHTMAGTGTAGFSGDSGPATSAKLYSPYAVAFDLSGNWYIADSTNYRVRKVDTTGTITTIAGSGDESTDGDGGAATSAGLFAPSGLAIDPAGNLYISARAKAADSRIRKVSAATGIISTVSMNSAEANYSASLYGPVGLALDGSGDLFFADSLNMQVKEILSNQVLLDFTASTVRQGSTSKTSIPQTVENDGNGPLDLTTITPGTNTELDPSVTTCNTTTSLPVDGDCATGVFFAPAATPALSANAFETGNVLIADDAGPSVAGENSPLAINVEGNAAPLNSTSISFVNPPTTIDFGTALTLNVSVDGIGTLAGTVTFTDLSQTPAVILGSGIAVNSGNTAFVALTGAQSAALLPVGLRGIQACYVATNDPAHSGSCTTAAQGSPPVPTPPLALAVMEATQVGIASDTKSPSGPGVTITFTATVAPSNGGGVIPTGTVVFLDGSTPLNATPLAVPANGIVQFPTVLANGSHTISAIYTPDAASRYVLGSQSANLTQNVLAGSSVSISSGSASLVYGSPVTFTVSVTPVPTGPSASEVVDVLVNGQNPQVALPGPVAGTWTFATIALPVGTDAVTASYSGDANQASANSPVVTEVVTAAPTTVSVTAPTSAVAGESIALTANVVAGSPSIATPAGKVTFTYGSPSIPLGSGVLSASGSITVNATLPASTTPYSVVATYAPAAPGGVTDFGPSSQTISLSVPFLIPGVTLSLPAPPTVQTATQFTITVAGVGPTPTGTVIFNDITDGTSSPAMTLVNGAATLAWAGFAKAGKYALTATYSGDTNYAPAPSSASTLLVNPIATQTTLGVASSGGTNPQTIVVAAVVSVNPAFPAPIGVGNVLFTSGSGTLLGTIPVTAGFATLPAIDLNSSVTSVTAKYDGGDQTLYGPSSAEAAVAVSDNATDFTMSLSKTAVTLSTSQNTILTVTLTPVNGFNEQMAFGCSGLPIGVSCTFTLPGSSVPLTSLQTLSGTAPLVIDLNIGTNNPLSGGATAANGHVQRSRTALAALWWPFGLLFGVLLWRLRKGHTLLATGLLILLLGGATTLMNGCGGVTLTSAKPGTYPIQVVAAGYLNNSTASSNISHSQALTLTIQ